MKIPPQYLPVMPYLILKDASGFLVFAKRIFNAVEQLIVPGTEARTIMHGEIKINDAVIMFAQSGDQWTEKPAGMFLYVENLDEIYQKAQEENLKILTSPSNQEYGYTFGFEDLFGNQWWIVQGITE